jgi:2-iminobutanoate/2-iminopropanoate deaminase
MATLLNICFLSTLDVNPALVRISAANAAHVPLERSCTMLRDVIQTDEAPKAIGPYSQAIRSEGMIYLSGQLGMDPATGQLVEGGVGPQIRRAIANLKAVLESAGSGLDLVVKTTIFLIDMGKFAEINAIYGEYFSVRAPARSVVQVNGLPRGAEIEIECIALPLKVKV